MDYHDDCRCHPRISLKRVLLLALFLHLANMLSHARPAHADPIAPPGITGSCQTIESLPPIFPDIPGLTGHITFTNSSLLVQLRAACREQQIAQSELLNLQNTSGVWTNTPSQLSALQTAAQQNDPALADYIMSQQLLNELSLDGQNLATAEKMADAAPGQRQAIGAATIVNANIANSLLKAQMLQATQIQAERAANANAATTLKNVFTAPSPDFGDGFML